MRRIGARGSTTSLLGKGRAVLLDTPSSFSSGIWHSTKINLSRPFCVSGQSRPSDQGRSFGPWVLGVTAATALGGGAQVGILSSYSIRIYILISLFRSNRPHHIRELQQEVEAQLTFAPEVPPPTDRKHPALVKVGIHVQVKDIPIDTVPHTYEVWSFNGQVPGPFIRAREGDTIEVKLYNGDMSGMPHNMDFHAVSGPGGGAPLLNCETGETRTGWFKLLYPGLYIYHCAVEPLGMHIGNGMYGMILVEPKEGLPKVDKEFYVMQAEYYTTKSTSEESKPNKLDMDYDKGLDENPTHVVFNGAAGRHTDEGKPLEAKVGERVRIYFGNIGPNCVSSFHVIGTIMDKVYREGDLISPPARGVQTTLVPAGGAAVIEFVPQVPGTYTLVDHSIFRVDKGAVAFLNVTGEEAPELYTGCHPPKVCPGY